MASSFVANIRAQIDVLNWATLETLQINKLVLLPVSNRIKETMTGSENDDDVVEGYLNENVGWDLLIRIEGMEESNNGKLARDDGK